MGYILPCSRALTIWGFSICFTWKLCWPAVWAASCATFDVGNETSTSSPFLFPFSLFVTSQNATMIYVLDIYVNYANCVPGQLVAKCCSRQYFSNCCNGSFLLIIVLNNFLPNFANTFSRQYFWANCCHGWYFCKLSLWVSDLQVLKIIFQVIVIASCSSGQFFANCSYEQFFCTYSKLCSW